ncbi:MAG: bifunctional hydroxymethylpyrimidine kinase/phosphomethylpyrimidine kinase [Deltaproteobacteria bacterium]|nr:bifunctional hydroxymethylpyrimidine kinase/phosphomethylpyrimidine kinase [Deltaproteobacteria bacterium]MBW2338765.1 bifunctional hydroxymethylpyrimidine kinase/phosphomethylpyrimidine kinase [Deltaproteobacteria bacterium]
MFGFVDILTPNEVEAGTLTGDMAEDLTDANRAASKLLEAGAGHT